MTDTVHPYSGWRPIPRGRIAVGAVIACALVAILAILVAWDLPPFGGRYVTTENAYVRGRTTVIAPQVSGYVAQVLVQDYQQVRKGQLLVQIDDSIYRARVAQAKANLAAAEAALANSRQARASSAASLAGQAAVLARAKADLTRIEDLTTGGAISAQQRDLARSNFVQAVAARDVARQSVLTVDVGRAGLEAQVAGARAQLRLAEIDLEHTAIRAPESGQLGEIGVRLGQYVTNGTQLVALVPAARWIIANYKEAQTADIRAGQTADITVEALAGERFKGRVEKIAPAAGSEFSILKPDNATGNFVKVPQRIGVFIGVEGDGSKRARLRPGMSVEVRVDTQSVR